MNEKIFLIMALTFAVPYWLLVGVMIAKRGNDRFSVLLGVALAILWPACFFSSVLEVVVSLVLVVFWWTCDFSVERAFKAPLTFDNPFPPGAQRILMVTGVALIVVCWWIFSEKALPFGLG